MSSLISKVYTLNSSKDLILKEEVIEIGKYNDDYIIAETIYSCISPGTEVAAYAGMTPLRPGNPYPRLVGYCNVAEVIETGKNVKDVLVGDHILTFQSHRDKFVISSNDFYLVLSQNIDLKYACTAYLFHLGYHSLITGEVKQGHTVGIIGAGVLGVSAALMSNVAGANTYLFTNQKHVSTKQKLNYIKCIGKSEEELSKAVSEAYETGFDIIVNTSNSWDDWSLALRLARKGGVIVNIGFPGRGQQPPMFNPLDPQYVYTKNLTIRALSFINESEVEPHDIRFSMKRNLQYILGLFNSGKLDPKELLTEEINFLELEKQYQKYLERKSRMLSSLITWKS
jgi:2-desacetyl-2-hydroxyethyl bacteriochlorophyllide A dehydrogenase